MFTGCEKWLDAYAHTMCESSRDKLAMFLHGDGNKNNEFAKKIGEILFFAAYARTTGSRQDVT